MKAYKVFEHPTGNHEAVKLGWSWPGFFFTCIWAFVKKLWGIGIGLLVGCVIWGVVDTALNADSDTQVVSHIIGVIVSIVFGYQGNAWRAKNLASRGYKEVGTVDARNPDEAIALYLRSSDRNAGDAPQQPAYRSGRLQA